MPLGERGGDTSSTKYCGIEIRFNSIMKDAFGFNVGGGFDFVVAPLIKSQYRPSSYNIDFGEQRKPYAKSDMSLIPSLWKNHVIGKVSTWIDLDSDDETLRKDSEIILKEEIAWASYLSLKACLLPAPKGTTLANYAKCVNQILHGLDKMQLWLRIPLGKLDDDSSPSFNTSVAVDSWETWNSFRLLCDHHKELFVVLDNLGILPSDNSLSRWYGEPVAASIIHINSFFTSDYDNQIYLSWELQKLITHFLNHNTQIIISEEEALTITGEEEPSEEEPSDIDSDADSPRLPHPLRPYLDYVGYLYKQLDPLSEQESSQFPYRDVLLPTIQPLKTILDCEDYENLEKDTKKYKQYKKAICKVLKDKVPTEKASMITPVLVVVGAGRGPLVRASLNAAKKSGRKLKVYAVEKNVNAVSYLNELCRLNGWEKIVTPVHADVRYWNAPETADILVSELQGSFGDNGLSPECLDVAQRFLKEDGILIPSSYTSFLQPVTAANLYDKVRGGGNVSYFETAFVANMHNVARLAPTQPVFTFTHPKDPVKESSNLQYKILRFAIPDDTDSAMVHGFAGYFDATLYKDMHLGNEPSRATPGVFTWPPAFFPLRTPICVPRGSTLEVHIWRFNDSEKVWYEWCVTSPSVSPIHNVNGGLHSLKL